MKFSLFLLQGLQQKAKSSLFPWNHTHIKPGRFANFPGKSGGFTKDPDIDSGIFGLSFQRLQSPGAPPLLLPDRCVFSVVYTRKLFQGRPRGHVAAFLAFTLFCSRGKDELLLLYLGVIAQNYQLPVLMCARYLHNLSQKLMGKHVKHYVSLDILGCFWP